MIWRGSLKSMLCGNIVKYESVLKSKVVSNISWFSKNLTLPFFASKMSKLCCWCYVALWSTDICFSDALSSTTWSHLDKNYGEREGETAGLSALPSQMPGLDWTVIFNPYSFASNCPLLSAGEGENRAVFSLRWKYCSWMERGYSHWQIVSIFGLSPGRKRQRENIFKQDHFQERAPYI